MPDPADKSDDLIAELAKLMASTPGGNKPSVATIARPAPLDPSATSQPSPIRIPGMDTQAASAGPQPDSGRAAVTGSIRIPGMDQPAPVQTSAPVSKFDFGSKPAVAPIKQEPLSSFSDRLAAGRNLANDPAPKSEPPSAPIRIPSDLKPVSENRSFAEGPALAVSKPAPAVSAPAASDFNFDFGFNQPTQPVTSASAVVTTSAVEDPIGALIEAEIDSGESDDPEDLPAPAPAAIRPANVTPINRTPVNPQVQPSRPTISPISSAPVQKPANTPIPLKPVTVAPRAPEADRFAISPGVGLNMKPPASQPLNPQPRQATVAAPIENDESDPMSEIESLIGEAVRVELSPGPVRVQASQSVAPKVELEDEDDVEAEIHARPEPAPVVPPLTTQFAPRRANLKEDAGANSAEAAILAAAAASGAEVGRVEPAVGDESPYRRLKVKPQRSSFLSGGMRQYVGMAVAGTLLLAAGLGLYWVLNMGRISSTGANAPKLTADTTQVKVKATPAPKPTTDTAKSPVLAKMDNASSAAPSSELLVSTDQTAGGTVTRDVTPAADLGENGLANRKVRTVTVRPDGTIVSGDDAVAGGEELPVDRPNVPTVPSTETPNLLNDNTQVAATEPTTNAPTATASVTAPTNSTAVDVTSQMADLQPTIDPTAVAPQPMTFPVRTGSSTPLAVTNPPKNTSVNAVVDGAQTPNGQIDLLGGGNQTPAPTQTASVKTTPTPTPTAPASSGNVGAYVQLSSQPTQADAQNSIKAMTAKYGSIFGGNKLVVQQVDLGQKGIRYRVRLPVGSLGDANSICAQIKAQGGDCFATGS